MLIMLAKLLALAKLIVLAKPAKVIMLRYLCEINTAQTSTSKPKWSLTDAPIGKLIGVPI